MSGRTPPRELAETLAAYERGEINVLVNAQLLAEGWNSPRATVCMHLAPTASRRVYQQRIGRIMRMHPRKEAGVVVDFVPKAATHAERVISLHSLLDADFYREGARVTPAPRRRATARPPQLVSGSVARARDAGRRRRLAVIQREWQRVDPKFLDDDEQRFWATIAGRQIRFDQRAEFARKFAEGRAGKGALETFLATCAAENPNRRLRMTALADRVGTTVERADFDDLVTLVTQAPPWEKDRASGVRVLLRAIGEGKANAPDQILARWTWRLARAVRKTLDRKGSQEFPEAKRLLGAVANSRGHRHEENVVPSRPDREGRCRSRSRPRCSPPPRATRLGPTACSIRHARISAPIQEIANALADNLPAPKAPTRKSRRRRRKKKPACRAGAARRRPRRRLPSDGDRPAEAPAVAALSDARAKTKRPRSAPGQPPRGPGGSPSPRCSRSRSRRKRISSPASASPLGSSPSSLNSSIVSARRSSSSTYAGRLCVRRDRLAHL